MSKARILAILAFITLGGAGGSLIVGDAIWFACTATAAAVLLIAWARAAHVSPQPSAQLHHYEPPSVRHVDEPCPIATALTYDAPIGQSFIRGGQEPLWVPGLNCRIGERFPGPRAHDDLRPTWTTDIYGAPE